MKIKSALAALLLTCISFNASARQAGDTYANKVDHNLSYEVVEMDEVSMLCFHYAKYTFGGARGLKKAARVGLNKVTDDLGIEKFGIVPPESMGPSDRYFKAWSSYWHFDLCVIPTDEKLKEIETAIAKKPKS